jgi:FkbM family methyltransferase
MNVLKKLCPESVKPLLRPLYHTFQWWYVNLNPFSGENHVAFRIDSEPIRIYYPPYLETSFSRFKEDATTLGEGLPIELFRFHPRIDTFIDIGSYHGVYSVLAKTLNPDVRLISFEPSERNRRHIEQVLSLNQVSGEVRSEVITGHSGQVSFHVEGEGSVHDSIAERKEARRVMKDALALSDVLDDARATGVFLKIDVEGAEEAILKDVFPAPIPYLEGIVELHPDKMRTSPDELVARLEQHCDRVEIITDSSPDHPEADAIDFRHNRPIYYFRYSGRSTSTQTR